MHDLLSVEILCVFRELMVDALLNISRVQAVCLCECYEGASTYVGLMAGYIQAFEIVMCILKLSTDRIVKIFYSI